MQATIETIRTDPNQKAVARNGVICLFCGLPTPVEASHRIYLVRCHACGKEAPYLAGDLVEYGPKLRTIPEDIDFRFRF